MIRPNLLAAAGLIAISFSASATTYNGNGNTGFGGPVGGGSLTLTDNGATISGTFTKGPNGVNDSLVLYIDSVSGGFADTSGFADANDGLRKSISGFDGGANRSLLTFASGFSPDYAIALGPANSSFGGLWQLNNGGANSLNFISTVNLNPVGSSSSATYTFSFDASQIGLTPFGGQSFQLFGTYTSDSGFRSDEAIAGNDSGTQGWNPFTQTGVGNYTLAVPEPSTIALASLGGIGALLALKRRNR
jgi:hypothetical protein